MISFMYFDFSNSLFVIFFVYVDMYQSEVWTNPEVQKDVCTYGYEYIGGAIIFFAGWQNEPRPKGSMWYEHNQTKCHK